MYQSSGVRPLRSGQTARAMIEMSAANGAATITMTPTIAAQRRLGGRSRRNIQRKAPPKTIAPSHSVPIQ